ncbi:MAG: hypothetical protein U9N42_05460 [Campylobacterota bacterium]|nr:hypothetical protein [Campylobacterota bacterium]
MYIKRYILATIILIVVVSGFIFGYITKESISFELYGFVAPTLPIAMWVALAMSLVFVASILHMSFYSLISSVKLRRYNSDFETFKKAIRDAFLSRPNRFHNFKTERYRLLGKIIDNSTLIPGVNLAINEDKISELVQDIEAINSGKIVDVKKYSMVASNPLYIKNEHNKYDQGQVSPERILGNADKNDASLCEKAYKDFVINSPLEPIKKYKEFITKEALNTIISRANSGENSLNLSNETLVELISRVSLNSEEYIDLSILSANSMVPEQRIKLFEMLSDEDENATSSYLYTLFDLQMIDDANDILANTQENEYLYFKAYSALKDCNKNFSIDLFINDSRKI